MRVLGYLLALAAAPSAALGADRYWSVFGGVQTDNVWEEVVLFEDIEILDAQLLGVAVGQEWPLGARGLSFGVEGQMVRHFGDQTHWEFNLPAFLRWSPDWPIIDSFAYGLGLSYATEEPQIEIQREGQSRQTLFYWTAEIAFDTPSETSDLFFCLHHRSSGFGFFGDSGSSNALVLGLRQQF